MNLADHINGIQHIGIPTQNMEKTLAFYRSLGFESFSGTEFNGKHFRFLSLKNIVLEIIEKETIAGCPGATDHIALDVDDIETVFRIVSELGYKPLTENIQNLPLLSNGVRCFAILGPNGEKIEFNQIL